MGVGIVARASAPVVAPSAASALVASARRPGERRVRIVAGGRPRVGSPRAPSRAAPAAAPAAASRARLSPRRLAAPARATPSARAPRSRLVRSASSAAVREVVTEEEEDPGAERARAEADDDASDASSSTGALPRDPPGAPSATDEPPNHWRDALPANDAIDKQILKLFVPAMLNFLIIPLVGAVDVFWVGRMGSAVALAAQGAANQVFQSAFWIISFVPSIIAPVVAKAAASGDDEEVQRAVGEAVFVASLVGLFGMALLTAFQARALGVVGVVAGSPTAVEAGPYIAWRAATFVPAIISTVGFAAFRGTLDVKTPMKITLASQLVNLLLDPLLIFGAGFVKSMGVAGAAMATSASEVTSAFLYIRTMFARKIITAKSMFRVPSFRAIGALMVGGAAVQLRSVAQNVTFLAVMRAILTMDETGAAAAAHTVSAQMFQLGVIAILALSTLASILIPQRINAAGAGPGGKREAKKVADRLLVWGLVLGVLLGGLQASALPAIQYFTPLENVQEMARAPVLIGAVQMPLNGLVFVCEGLMQGHQAFARLAGGMFVSTALMIGALKLWGTTLEGVWFCFFVFNISRLAFGLRHHLVDGPLAPAKLREERRAEAEGAREDAKGGDARADRGEDGDGALRRALRT